MTMCDSSRKASELSQISALSSHDLSGHQNQNGDLCCTEHCLSIFSSFIGNCNLVSFHVLNINNGELSVIKTALFRLDVNAKG